MNIKNLLILLTLMCAQLLIANVELGINVPINGTDPAAKANHEVVQFNSNFMNTSIEICIYNGLGEKLSTLDVLRLNSPILDTIFYNDHNCVEVEMDISSGNEWTIVADSLGFINGLTGINIIDIIDVRRDLLDQSPLPNRLAKIAGMFANSSSTTAITQLTRAILGYPESIHHARWILIDSSLNYPFYNSSGGVSLYAPTVNSSFIPTELFAIKSGDVNFSELTGENIQGILKLRIQDIIIDRGEFYEIPVTVDEGIELDGFQIELNSIKDAFEEIEVVGNTPHAEINISPELSAFDDKMVLLNLNSDLSLSQLNAGDTIMTLHFHSLENGILSEMLTLYAGTNNLAIMPIGQHPKEIVFDWKDKIISNNVHEIELEKISLFPNPASEYLEIKGITSTINYQITDMLGKVFSTGIVAEDARLNVANLNNGMYVLTMMNATGARKSFKFFVAK